MLSLDVVRELTQILPQAVLESREPVILNCYAEWCREQLSTMANAVAGTPGIKLAVMDVDKCPEIAQQLKVQNLPTIFLFHNGKVKQSTVGSLSADGIQTFIKKATALSGGTAPSANELMIQAGKLLSESRVEEALQVYMQVAQMSREVHGASALAGMTLCALAVKDMEAAKELVETIKKDFPKALEDEIVKQAITAVSALVWFWSYILDDQKEMHALHRMIHAHQVLVEQSACEARAQLLKT